MLAPTVLILLSSLICLVANTGVNITHVHVVYMNHLDVGYDGIYPELGFIVNVINKYFDVFFPSAYDTAATLLRMNVSEGFIYTTHPFLVSLYLDCPPNMGLHCPNESMVKQFTEAVNNGWIAWHAGAFNAEPEFYDPSLFQFFISVAHDLNRMFGQAPVATMSQRDVPGLTRSAIPLLKQMGVQALSFGANSYSAPAAVPTAFLWRDPPSGEQIITLYHPGGYGGIMLSDAVIVPNLTHALIMAFNQDNQGPQNVSQVLDIIAQVKQDFPGAEIKASTWDEFTSLLVPLTNVLPLIEQEMGDTWIYGIASDPLKVASWRAILRARTACLAASVCNATEYAFKNFSRILIKGAEHTWGMQSAEQHLMVYFDWTNEMFERLRMDPEIQNMQLSWAEQRLWVTDYPLQALTVGNSTADRYLLFTIHSELAQLAPAYPNVAGWTKIQPGEYNCGRFVIAFAPDSGAITSLFDTKTESQWAGEANPIGLPVYQTLTEFDFEDFLLQYSLCQGTEASCAGGLRNDFSKPWLQVTANPVHQLVVPSLQGLFFNASKESTDFLLFYQFPAELVTRYGAPASVWLAVSLNNLTGNVSLDVSFFNKPTTRQPEALWVQFTPMQSGDGVWLFDKLGEWVGTNETMLNGSHHLHAVNTGVRFTNSNGTRLFIQFIDSSLVSAGSPNGLPVPLTEHPDMVGGVWANVYNNFWNTNYVLWYPYESGDQNIRARYSLCFDC